MPTLNIRFLFHSTLLAASSILLSGCPETKDVTSIDKLEIAMNNLQHNMYWRDSCLASEVSILSWTAAARNSVDTVIADPINSPDSQQVKFIKGPLKEKLDALTVETQYIIKHCNSPDYAKNGFAFANDGPFVLSQGILEWKATIAQLTKSILDPQPLERAISQDPTLIPTRQYDQLSGGETFRDCTSSYCTNMAIIPPGNSVMGATDEEQVKGNWLDPEGFYADADFNTKWDLPRHTITLKKAFAMSTTEVTYGSFKEFIKETGHLVPEGCRGRLPGQSGSDFHLQMSYNQPGYTQTDVFPVSCVRKEDAEAYARWLSIKTGAHYRLPSEAEWEYAARAGTESVFPWGDDSQLTQACTYANVADIDWGKADPLNKLKTFNCQDGFVTPSPVATFKATGYGLYDIIGNQREFVSDCWHPNYIGSPTDGSPWNEGAEECFSVNLHGGSWNYAIVNDRIAMRDSHLSSQSRANSWGFRLVREL